MLVRDYMSQPPIVISPKTPISEALRMMRERGIRRFPVVDPGGRLVGIVSDRDLLHAEPSPATSLSIWEITYLLGRITVEQVMTRDVLTVGPTTPPEEAAQIKVDRKIGGLPVVEADLVLGVITETDIFRVFALILGANERGTGVTVTAIDRPGLLADLTRGHSACRRRYHGHRHVSGRWRVEDVHLPESKGRLDGAAHRGNPPACRADRRHPGCRRRFVGRRNDLGGPSLVGFLARMLGAAVAAPDHAR